MRRYYWISVLLSALIGCSPEQNRTDKQRPAPSNLSFYFAAHPDDWQLFIGEQAWENLRDTTHQVVFVLSTAGDAAMGISAADTANMPYYKARERGFIHSVQWAAEGDLQADSTGKATLPLLPYTLKDETINGHVVRSFSYKNAKAYLFYLPDGFPDGGYTWSLQKLKQGEIDEMPSIDSATVYTSWDDLRTTLTKLVEQHLSENQNVTFNLAERDTTLNPGDHSDHWYTSLIADEATQALEGTRRYFIEYHTASLDTNLSKPQIAIKQFLFSPCALSKEDAGYVTPWEPHHLAWTYRSYFREE